MSLLRKTSKCVLSVVLTVWSLPPVTNSLPHRPLRDCVYVVLCRKYLVFRLRVGLAAAVGGLCLRLMLSYLSQWCTSLQNNLPFSFPWTILAATPNKRAANFSLRRSSLVCPADSAWHGGASVAIASADLIGPEGTRDAWKRKNGEVNPRIRKKKNRRLRTTPARRRATRCSRGGMVFLQPAGKGARRNANIKGTAVLVDLSL